MADLFFRTFSCGVLSENESNLAGRIEQPIFPHPCQLRGAYTRGGSPAPAKMRHLCPALPFGMAGVNFPPLVKRARKGASARIKGSAGFRRAQFSLTR